MTYKIVSQRITVHDNIITFLQNDEDVIRIDTWKREDYPEDIDMWNTAICYQDLKSWDCTKDYEGQDMEYYDAPDFHGSCERFEAHKKMVEYWKNKNGSWTTNGYGRLKWSESK
jgi:hypothetical protein